MKTLFILFFLTNPSWAGSAIELNDFLKNATCPAEVSALVTSWGAQTPWRIEFQQKHEAQAIKAPSQQIGTWILLEKSQDLKNITAIRLSPLTRLQVSWTQPACKQSVKEIAMAKKPVVENPDRLVFDDTSLEKLIDEKQNGIIYAVSEHMHLSVEALPIIKSVAAKNNLKLTIVTDGESKLKFPILKSQDLVMRGLTMHYPSIILYSKDGQLSAVFPGHKSEKEYLNFTKDFIK